VGGTPVGQLIVQMVDAQRIQVEMVPSLTPPIDVTSGARFFIR